jgi:hypothetical protein
LFEKLRDERESGRDDEDEADIGEKIMLIHADDINLESGEKASAWPHLCARRGAVAALLRRDPSSSIMNDPAASCGVSEECDENYSKGGAPECFYRGSSSGFAWIPA